MSSTGVKKEEVKKVDPQLLSLMRKAYRETSEWIYRFEQHKSSWKRIAYQVKPLGQYVYAYVAYVREGIPKTQINSSVLSEFWKVYEIGGSIYDCESDTLSRT